MSRSRHWCFTINNYTDAEQDRLRSLGGAESTRYIIFGRERGESGTPHLQGFVSFHSVTSLRSCKRLLGTRAHIESARGSPSQAASYCKKEGDFEEIGSPPSGQGRRTDLESIKESIKNGATAQQIAEDNFTKWCQYRKSFDAYRNLVAVPVLRTDLRVYTLIGTPGTGKTRLAYTLCENPFITHDGSLKWWDGYVGQLDIIIDDYRGGADSSFLLRLLDIYPFKVPIKGDFVDFVATRIFITSNMSIPWDHHGIEAALRRRIKDSLTVTTALDFDDHDVINKLKDRFS